MRSAIVPQVDDLRACRSRRLRNHLEATAPLLQHSVAAATRESKEDPHLDRAAQVFSLRALDDHDATLRFHFRFHQARGGKLAEKILRRDCHLYRVAQCGFGENLPMSQVDATSGDMGCMQQAS